MVSELPSEKATIHTLDNSEVGSVSSGVMAAAGVSSDYRRKKGSVTQGNTESSNRDEQRFESVADEEMGLANCVRGTSFSLAVTLRPTNEVRHANQTMKFGGSRV